VPARLAALALLVAAASAGSAERFAPTPDELKAAYRRAESPPKGGGRVLKDRVEPHWFAGDSRFWYRNNLPRGTKEFILVDADAGTRSAAFDHRKLAAALSKATSTDHAADRLPFDEIEFVNDHTAVRFRVGGMAYTCDLATYDLTTADAKKGEAPADEQPVALQQPRKGGNRSGRSPDGKWTAAVRDDNLFLTPADGQEVRLTKDGKPGQGYGQPSWSPDSKALVAFRIETAERKDVYYVESSPKGGGRAVLHTRPYALPGDPFTTYEPHLFDPATGSEIKLDVDTIDFGFPRVRWAKGGDVFRYEKIDRGHQRFRVVEVNARTGKSRNVIDETTDTFIWTAHLEGFSSPVVTWLEKTDELIHASEKSGWRHLYLIDAAGGKSSALTSGEWVVRGIDRIDEESRQVWFRACGVYPGQDPYLVHHLRVNFDGTGLVKLTAGDGTHTVKYSPGRKYLIDTYSRADRPPVHELRKTTDGSLVTKLEAADVSELGAGWKPPEVFTAKGRDGTTDIWGLIHRPARFDPSKAYPVVEAIYAGPHNSHVPKAFNPPRRFAALNELGFVVVQIDGMGTANRSKAFHDVCWKNLKDAGFPDRILWHKAAAAKYPWYDATRVGIYGTSAGGQNSTGALLFHGDFYKAAVSACGCHDNRMDKASWNEQWMGLPVGPQYSACSNIDNAHRLRGKLLLIVGEADTNVPPESTYRLCDALIRAGKQFDFLMVPGMGHSDGGVYGRRRLHDFFVRHLHGVEPPDRSADPE
jgi:dipeptidyl aminopeptidase/acylaminoacyl peptidase